mmetsp:Transcript_62436/g.115936  ORF Transcript_62436/g.115936 Transcript_62436/m.115936 type:complete len:536 (+) Transcript_62436:118-1725(+)
MGLPDMAESGPQHKISSSRVLASQISSSRSRDADAAPAAKMRAARKLPAGVPVDLPPAAAVNLSSAKMPNAGGSRRMSNPGQLGSRQGSKESLPSRQGSRDLQVRRDVSPSTLAALRGMASDKASNTAGASARAVPAVDGDTGGPMTAAIPLLSLRSNLAAKTVRPASAGATLGVRSRAGSKGVPLGSFGNAPWVRANEFGPVRLPKTKADAVKLNDFFSCCRNGNYRDVRALACADPHLLWLTDRYGFTALHHAAMSMSRDFVAQVLDLYHDPRNYVRKLVTYKSDEDFMNDKVALCDAAPQADEQQLESGFCTHEPLVVLQRSREKGLAFKAHIMPGDVLYMVSRGDSGRPIMAPEDFLRGARGYKSRDGWWPLTLEFRGPACSEIIGKDGWTPGHGAAGIGPACKGVLGILLEELHIMSLAPRDWKGCTVEKWVELEHETTVKPGKGTRRPLSAGAAPTRREQARLGLLSGRSGSKVAALRGQGAPESPRRNKGTKFGPVEAECPSPNASPADVFPGIIPRGPPCCFEIPVS